MRGCQLAHLRLAVLKKKIRFEGERVGILKFCISRRVRHDLTVSLVHQGHSAGHAPRRAAPSVLGNFAMLRVPVVEFAVRKCRLHTENRWRVRMLFGVEWTRKCALS